MSEAPAASRGPRRPRRRTVVAIAVAAALVAGGGITAVTLLRGPSPEQIAAAEDRWGLSPDPHAVVDLQPDVVVLEHGALAVEGPRDDGLTWHLNGGHPGLDRITEGSVLFLTNRIVGRVGAIGHPDDGGIDVTLLPVDLPEVVRTLDLEFDRSLSAETLSVDVGAPAEWMATDTLVRDDDSSAVDPESLDPDDVAGDETSTPDPGASGEPEPEPEPSASPASLGAPGGVVLASARSWRAAADDDADDAASADPEDPDEEPARPEHDTPMDKFARMITGLDREEASWEGESKDVKVGPFGVEVSADASSFGFTATIEKDGLIGGIAVKVAYTDLQVTGAAPIRDGRWVPNPTMIVHGVTGVDVSFAAGVEGLGDNVNFTVEIPIELSESVLVSGVPVSVDVEFKFSFGTALTAKHSTMFAHGVYGLDGDIGIRSGQAVVPNLTVKQPMIDSISPASLGIDSVVFGFKAKVGVGIGAFGLLAGPFASLTASAGVLRGTALTAPWGVPCQVTLVASAGGGVGAKLGTQLSEWISRLTPLSEPPQLEVTFFQKTDEFLNRTVNMPICPARSPTDEAPQETPPVEKRQTGGDPYTAAGGRTPPGRGQQYPPRPDAPVTEGTENPNTGDADPIDGDGLSSGGTGSGSGSGHGGHEPPPRPAGEDDDYSLEYDYCDLQPDPRHPERDATGGAIYFSCADFEPDVAPPDADPGTDGGRI